MDKITMANALKAVFGTSITPTSSQFVPITASDGTPAGISSMANLASVLGAQKKQLPEGTDLDTVTGCGYFCTGSMIQTASIVNKPNGIQYAFCLLVAPSYNYTPGYQLLVETVKGLENIYIRGYDGTFGAWKKIALANV